MIRYPQKFPPRGVAKYRGIVTRGCQIIPAAACISLASMAESLSDCSMDLESAEEEIEIESEGAENVKSTPNAEHNEHWNEEIALNFKEYLMSGRYPDTLPKEKRRNFRKRANDFEVMDGKLFYKKSGSLRLALYRNDDWLLAFEV